MGTKQTTIPFNVKKKTSYRSKKIEKENSIALAHENARIKPEKRRSTEDESYEPMASPKKQDKPLNPKDLNESIPVCNSNHSTASRALHSSLPIRLAGRDDKLQELSSIISHHYNERTSGNIYISGPPGTGKTACINSLRLSPLISTQFHTCYVNCSGIKSSIAIYKRLAEEFHISSRGSSPKTYLAALELYLKTTKKMILLILDEIDELDSKRQEILYTIMEWPSKFEGKIILIGISNTLDLTHRLLPRLMTCNQAKEPTLIHFSPYNKDQIKEIIEDRLKEAGIVDLFSAPIIQLMASKAAALSGDLRKALDLSRRVVALSESRKDGKINLKDVLDIMDNVYGTSVTLTDSSKAEDKTSDAFPLQQKILIATLLLIKQNSKNKEVTIGKVHEVYKKVCERRNLSYLDLSEFLSLTVLVESRGIAKIIGKTKNRLSKVILQWDEKEVSNSLQDRELLAAILSDVSCLN